MTNPSVLRHPTAKIVSLAVLLAGLPVALYLVFNAVRLWPKAQVAPVNVFLEPASATLPPNQTLNLKIDAGTNRIGFAHVELTFDQTKVNLASEITVSSALKTVVTKTSMADANSTGRVAIVAGIDPADIPNAPTGVFSFASLSFTTVSTVQNDTAHVAFDQPRLETFDTTEARLSSAASDATLTLNPTGGGGARLFFSPATASLPPNRSVELRLDSGTHPITFVDVSFTFDRAKVRLSGEMQTDPAFGAVISKSTSAEANASGQAAIVLGLCDPFKPGCDPVPTGPTGNILIATIPLTAVSTAANDQTTLQSAAREIVNQNFQALTVTTENGTINLNTGGGGTPTRTPTPSRTPSPTRTPTPTPTGTQCLQVLTPARCIDVTKCALNQCQTFPTSCLPDGWVADPSCAATPTPTPIIVCDCFPQPCKIGTCPNLAQCVYTNLPDGNACTINNQPGVCQSGTCIQVTPTPTTDPTRSQLTIKIRLQGITVKAADQKLRFTFVSTAGTHPVTVFQNVLATNGADGVYTATIPNITSGQYNLYVKSPSHLQRAFPLIMLDPGVVVLDLTNIVSF